MAKKYFHIVLCFAMVLFLSMEKTFASPGKTNEIFSADYNLFDTTITAGEYSITTNIFLPPDFQRKKIKYPVIYFLNTKSSAHVINDDVADTICSYISKNVSSAIIFEISAAQKNGFALVDSDWVSCLAALKKKTDKIYKTDAAPESCIIAGSYTDAAIIMKIALENATVFGRSGIFLCDFSSFSLFEEWLSDNFSRMNGMMFIHSYDADDSDNGKKIKKTMDEIGKHSSGLLYNFLEAKTEESNLKPAFLEFYKWILSNGHNYILKTGTLKKESKRKAKP